MKIDFYLRFRTRFGQALSIVGNIPELGNNLEENAVLLKFLNEEYWHLSITIDPQQLKELQYRYIFTNEKNEQIKDGEKYRTIDIRKIDADLVIVDSWNDASFYENAFYTTPFKKVFFKHHKKYHRKKPEKFTHLFKVKAPLLAANETACLIGSDTSMGGWNLKDPLIMGKQGDWYFAAVDLANATFPIFYKYGIYDLKQEKFVRFENGDNRILHNIGTDIKQTILHDGFLQLPNTSWKGAGVAIPVFSLRTNNGFGIGEFADIKLLVDWASETGLKLIQLLPINDTSATNSWKDSYPYSAISAFALHPAYINLHKVAGKKFSHLLRSLAKKQKQLNALAEIDYDQVVHFKVNVLRELYEADSMEFLHEEEYKNFFESNKHWLVPYAAFCFFRDKYNTSDYSKWKTHAEYNADEIEKFTSPKYKPFTEIAFFYFVQYHLHLQLKDAVDYAHKKSIAIKGDIPIGIYRYGCDAWTAPELYNMDMQAGAPPDDFTIKGQNWGFPTYNWKKMEEDHFDWWKQRFQQMSNYFDAFRIDHILGFFRIWSIPIDSHEGILGRFIPAIPVTVHEFGERGVWFDYNRFCKPFITDTILKQIFKESAGLVKDNFLLPNDRGGFDLKDEFATQAMVEDFFAASDEFKGKIEIKQGLFELLTNVILYERPGSNKQEFDFRILIELTTSFQYLDEETKRKVNDLYINYFYRRQDDFWEKEAMKKLPALKDATNMLICGEDLGMVPHCVPHVMKQLGILSLEIQRMPKDVQLEFFHPKMAPYLSVITPSTHDMSTIRGWWEEDRITTQKFYNTILGEQGTAPFFCESWINRAIVLQHLYSPAMWSIFQIQDILGMSEKLRRENPLEERINNPANPEHYWNYRMHITLEQLIKEKEFNTEFNDYITNSGRA